jgi:hypothetical protein
VTSVCRARPVSSTLRFFAMMSPRVGGAHDLGIGLAENAVGLVADGRIVNPGVAELPILLEDDDCGVGQRRLEAAPALLEQAFPLLPVGDVEHEPSRRTARPCRLR